MKKRISRKGKKQLKRSETGIKNKELVQQINKQEKTMKQEQEQTFVEVSEESIIPTIRAWVNDHPIKDRENCCSVEEVSKLSKIPGSRIIGLYKGAYLKDLLADRGMNNIELSPKLTLILEGQNMHFLRVVPECYVGIEFAEI